MSKKLKLESLFDLEYASDPQISADGNLVAFVVSCAKADKRGYESAIHLSRSGAAARQFSSGTGKDANPRFSPDGSQLAFTRASGTEKPQLMLMPVSGGEARTLTALKSGVSNPRFSRDGSKIGFLSRGDWEDAAAKDELPRVVTTLRYKQNGVPGAGVMPEEPLNLWTYNLESENCTQVAQHGADIEGFDWVDEQHLLFIAPLSLEASASWGSETFLVKIGKSPKQLTHFRGAMGSLSVSPDGSRAAIIADPDAGETPGDPHVYTFPIQQRAILERACSADVFAGQSVNSDAHFGAMPSGPFWLQNGELIVIHQFGGAGAITRIGTDGKLQRTAQPKQSSIAGLAVAPNGATAYLRETNSQPLEVFKGGRREAQLSALNPKLKGVVTEKLHHLRLERDGFTVEGWVLEPATRKEGKRYPVVLNVHGGPATAWGHGYMHEFQLMAAQGYAVCFCNIRGSTGYGDAQTAGTNGAYFGGDYEDLMAFLDACLEKFPWLDGSRSAVVGGSYGGVMTNWIISHTDRFKAAITDRCISNWVSFHGSSDIGYRFTSRELRSHVPADADRLWERSPLRYAAQVKTPCLIVHSEEDHRCPIEQSEQWFVALKKLGVETRFVRVPGENHDLSRAGRPDRRAFRLQEYLDWLERWL